MPQSKSATNAIETGSTAVCALVVGAFAVGAAANRAHGDDEPVLLAKADGETE